MKIMNTIAKRSCMILTAALVSLAGQETHAQNITASTPWVWMSGDSLVNQNGIYGTKGVPSVNNIPGGRKQSASWTDQKAVRRQKRGYGHIRSRIQRFMAV